jgi:hypothetical protein
LRENPFPASHPAHPQWIETGGQLATDLARAESAVWSARATPADATTLVESLATWTAAYFDASSHAHFIVVTDNGEVGLEAYQRVLDALRVQALKAGEALRARVLAQAQALTAAFPGATSSNATCLALVADVHQRLMPEVTFSADCWSTTVTREGTFLAKALAGRGDALLYCELALAGTTRRAA